MTLIHTISGKRGEGKSIAARNMQKYFSNILGQKSLIVRAVPLGEDGKPRPFDSMYRHVIVDELGVDFVCPICRGQGIEKDGKNIYTCGSCEGIGIKKEGIER